jgi:hypothetical protein
MLASHPIKKAAAVALALGAITPAAASAKPIGTTPFGENYTSPPPTTIVRVTTPASGFDWTDAGIGAAGGLAITMLGVGGALVVSQLRAHHPNRPTARTN